MFWTLVIERIRDRSLDRPSRSFDFEWHPGPQPQHISLEGQLMHNGTFSSVPLLNDLHTAGEIDICADLISHRRLDRFRLQKVGVSWLFGYMTLVVTEIHPGGPIISNARSLKRPARAIPPTLNPDARFRNIARSGPCEQKISSADCMQHST